MSVLDLCGWCGQRFASCYGVVDLAWCRMHATCELEYVDGLLGLFAVEDARAAAAKRTPQAEVPHPTVEEGRFSSGPCEKSSRGGERRSRATLSDFSQGEQVLTSAEQQRSGPAVTPRRRKHSSARVGEETLWA